MAFPNAILLGTSEACGPQHVTPHPDPALTPAPSWIPSAAPLAKVTAGVLGRLQLQETLMSGGGGPGKAPPEGGEGVLELAWVRKQDNPLPSLGVSARRGPKDGQRRRGKLRW